MRRFVRIMLAATLCTAIAVVGRATETTSFQGVYANATPDADVIAKAIDAAVSGMNFIKRPIARSRLTKTNTLYRRVEISQSTSEIRIRFDQGNPVAMPIDGSTVKWTRNDGEVFDVSASLQDAQLTQTFKAGDGQRVNHFSLSPDGATLTLQVTLSSPQLPEPVKYTLTFRRSQ